MCPTPTEEFPKLITFNGCFMEIWLGDDSKISMDVWNVYKETDKINKQPC